MMMSRGRPVKSTLSGASTARLPLDFPRIAAGGSSVGPHPTAHGLLVALVSAPGHHPTEAVAWPLWLVPRITRRPIGRGRSRTTQHPARE
jgi:hypothetical protein